MTRFSVPNSMAGRSRRRRGWAVLTAAALPLALLHASPAAGRRDAPSFLPALTQPRPVPVTPVSRETSDRVDYAARNAWRKPPQVTWPAAGTATVELAPAVSATGRAATSAPLRRAGSLPVSLAAAVPDRKTPVAGEPGPATVRVRVADRQATRRAGVTGMLLAVEPPAGKAAGQSTSDQLEVRVDYAGFRYAFGGDWGARLRLARMPACALTTPEAPRCQVKTPVPTRNDSVAGTLTARVAPGTVLAADAPAAGDKGDYKATSLKPSGSWTAGGSSGAFSWTYPIGTPLVPGGLEPDLALSYSSQSVDGQTATTNNQPSWVGDGWALEPGYVERRYQGCNDDMSGGNNAAKNGDRCWFNDNATLSLGGRTIELVHDPVKGWHPADDSGERVEKLTGAANGDDGGSGDKGEYWKVTTTDGTQYFFGRNRLPGWTAGKTETRSAWTVPVFGNQSGEPCHAAAFADSWCQQAWRWQLDYVVDVRGNAMAYYYGAESNFYARNVSLTTGKGTATEYVRGGYLDHIDYGLRADNVYATNAATGRVDFEVTERCLADCGTFDEAHAPNWPDVPVDMNCAAGAECKDKFSPTFWSRKRLTAINTFVLSGGAYKPVDTWALTHQFPASGDGSSPALWLASITRTGKAAGGSAALPPVTFLGKQLANRVDKTGDGLAPFIRYRVYQVNNETGGTIGVTYSDEDCTVSTLPDPASNTRRCYPFFWAGEGDIQKKDWFHRYVVTEVQEGDNLAETPDTVTRYTYPGGAAWTKSTDEFVKNAHRTYSESRGYGRVQVRTGDGADPRSLTETRYFRGVDGAAVTDSAGVAVTDREHFAGLAREKATYDGDGGALVSATSYVPWRSALTASRERSGLPDLQAYLTGTAEERTRTPIRGGVRTTLVRRSFDGYGMVTAVSESGDEGETGDEKCTTTTYARNTDLHLLDKVARVEAVAATCGATVSRPGDVVADTRTYYDGASTVGAAPTKGNVTRTEKINGDGNGYSTVSSTPAADYDLYGRSKSVTDAYGKTTTTTYTPASGEVPTRTEVANPLTHKTTTELDPARGQPTLVIDPNDRRTETTYDPLGRITGVWLPGRDRATFPNYPNHGFSYLVRRDAPTVVTSTTLQHDDTLLPSYALYDGLLRPVQTQAPTVGGGRLMSDTFYDSRGWTRRDSGTYYAAGEAGTVLAFGDATRYPAMTENVFDGAGRTRIAISKRYGDETKRTTTTYEGDRTTVVPPAGATARTTITDALDRTRAIVEYTNAARTESQTTSYRYDKRGPLAEVEDAAGNLWTYKYDTRGRKTETTDPDKGRSVLGYDVGDRLTSVTDARGTTLTTGYDALGRKTEVKNGATLLTKWTYDGVVKGHVDSATRYVDGNAYVSKVTAYSLRYQPTLTQVTVPATEGALAGTYQWRHQYNANTGQHWRSQHPATGGLPSEWVTTRFLARFGLPVLTGTTTDSLVGATTYDHYARPIRDELGEFGKKLFVSREYDEHTGSLTRTVTDRETAPQRIDDTSYTYDPAGNVTRITTASGQDAERTVDTQCFQTDALRRMTEAWTATDNCAASPSAATVGGPDAYWSTFGYDAVGNRTKEVQHRTPAGPAADVTRTYRYPAPKGPQPHTLSSVSQTGPAGESTEEYGYDPTGNTTRRKLPTGEQKLDWDAEGHLAKVTEGAKTTSFVYDADGARLIRRDASGVTLYLPGGNELRLPVGSSTAVGTRYYAHNGQTVAVKTGGKLSFLFADRHGTATTVVDAATLAVSRRRSMPFGAPRGTQPLDWPGEKGFVGGTTDTSTGLTHLGAREYDPATGRFISVDPVMDLNDPQQVHGYAYAHNNPVTYTDPDGLKEFISDTGGYVDTHGGKCKSKTCNGPVDGGWKKKPNSKDDGAGRPDDNGGNHREEGWKGHFSGAKIGIKKTVLGSLKSLTDVKSRVRDARCLAIAQADACTTIAGDQIQGLVAAGKELRSDFTQGRPGEGFGVLSVTAAAMLLTRKLPFLRKCHSFAPGTAVVMANGSTKPIERVKVGDRVRATDPKTNKTVLRTVTALHVNQDHDLVDVTVRDRRGRVAVLHTTAGHQIWDSTTRRWTPAGDLAAGHRLNTLTATAASTTTATVVAVRDRTTATTRTMHDLTIDEIHTYYVVAGDTPVLVHNCEKVYHRRQSPSQTPADAAMQEASGEIWGGPARNMFGDSGIPKVKAYSGPLPDGAPGIEFRTSVPPDRQGVPGKPTWSGPREGVRVEDGFAKICVTVTKNTQC